MQNDTKSPKLVKIKIKKKGKQKIRRHKPVVYISSENIENYV